MNKTIVLLDPLIMNPQGKEISVTHLISKKPHSLSKSRKKGDASVAASIEDTVEAGDREGDEGNRARKLIKLHVIFLASSITGISI